MKRLGTYTYKRYAGQVMHRSGRMQPSFENCALRVEVIDETQRKYRVKYLGFHANGAAVGSLAWVGKDKVALDQAEAAAKPAARQLEDIRLPYKD